MKRKKKQKSLGGRLLRIITLCFYGALGLAFLAKFISPESVRFLALFGLAFPYLFLINLCITFLWVLRRRRIAIYGMLLLVITSTTAKNFIRLFPKKDKGVLIEKSALEVVSFNVRNFNIYNHWNEDNRYKRRDSIFSFLQSQQAHIICLQESYLDSKGLYRTTDTLATLQKAINVHEYYPYKRENHNFGIATLTSLPIVAKNTLSLGTAYNNPCIYTDVLWGTDTLRIYNIHFASIGLSYEDYVFIESISTLNVGELHKTDAIRQSFLQIVRRLYKAFSERAEQVKKIMAHIEQSPYLVILCTDLNDTPSSYAYRELSKKLNDAFIASGRGVGRTYNGRLPYFRIDFIFYSDDFKAYNFTTHNYIDLSDHFPISTRLVKK